MTIDTSDSAHRLGSLLRASLGTFRANVLLDEPAERLRLIGGSIKLTKCSPIGEGSVRQLAISRSVVIGFRKTHVNSSGLAHVLTAHNRALSSAACHGSLLIAAMWFEPHGGRVS